MSAMDVGAYRTLPASMPLRRGEAVPHGLCIQLSLEGSLTLTGAKLAVAPLDLGDDGRILEAAAMTHRRCPAAPCGVEYSMSPLRARHHPRRRNQHAIGEGMDDKTERLVNAYERARAASAAAECRIRGKVWKDRPSQSDSN